MRIQVLGKEMTKEEFVTRYMESLRHKLAHAFRIHEFSAREELILEMEKQSCEQFYYTFYKTHGRGPDEANMEKEIAESLLQRVVDAFGRSKRVIDEQQFVYAHISQIKPLKAMRIETFVPEGYPIVLSAEKKKAREYFRKHDAYPGDYAHLLISRSHEAISKGLFELLEQFKIDYMSYYRQYKRKEC